jgi:predicted kinase
MDPLSAWWSLAGPSKFVAKIVKAVTDHRRVICITVPFPRPTGLVQAMKEQLLRDLSLECATLDLSGYDQSRSVAHILAEYLEVPAAEIGSVSDFASHPKLVDQVAIVDGIDKKNLRRWGLFFRHLQSENSGDAIVGPIVIALIPIGLTKEEVSELCGPARLFSSLGTVDRYDTTAYASALGLRPGSDLSARVGHAVMLDVAAWSRDLLESMMRWETGDQIDPMALLVRAAEASTYSYPSWENALVDLWDDEPVAHAVAAVKFGLHEHIRRRIWAAQASVLLPFTHRILRSLIARYHDVRSRTVSAAHPYVKRYNDREFVITDPYKLEFYDFKELTKNHLSPVEHALIKITSWARNAVAHCDVIPPGQIELLSDHYESNRDILDGDIPGWNWPRCGQTMILTVGPSGAGKSRWCEAQGIEIVSSDEIRSRISPDLEVAGNQAGIFRQVRTNSSRILASGRDVIVDAMHVEAQHRRRQSSVAPPDVRIRYVIIDRPLAEKVRDAGWRKEKGLVEKYDGAFSAQVEAALKGDNRPGVEIIDTRE